MPRAPLQCGGLRGAGRTAESGQRTSMDDGPSRTPAPQAQGRASISLSRVGAAVNVRPEEGGRVGLLFAVSFSIGFCRVFFDSTSNALFLSSFHISALAYVYIIGAVATT